VGKKVTDKVSVHQKQRSLKSVHDEVKERAQKRSVET
jgi:hypothetical protein